MVLHAVSSFSLEDETFGGEPAGTGITQPSEVQGPLRRALGLRLRLHFREKLRKSKNEQHWREEAKARKVKRDRGEVLPSGPSHVTLAHRQGNPVALTQVERVAGIPLPLASPSQPASPFQLNTFATLSIY